MLKFKISYVICGAIHRPAYDGTSEIWVNYPSEIQDRLYRKLKSGPFFEINREDIKIIKIISKEYLSLLD